MSSAFLARAIVLIPESGTRRVRKPRQPKNAGGREAARSIDQRQASRGFRLVPPAMVPAVIRDPVAVLTIVPAAVIEVGADVPHLVYHWGAVNRGPVDRVDDRVFSGTARQRGGRDGCGSGG